MDRVSLYRLPTDADSSTATVDAAAIADWLRDRVDAPVDCREPVSLDQRRLADQQVLDPDVPRTGPTTSGDIEGRLYDGHAVQRACNAAVGPDSLSHGHVVLLSLPIATWGGDRWHRRVSVLGQPAVVSVPGVWDAPAKPPQYYWLQRRYVQRTGERPPEKWLARRVDRDVLERGDPRTTDVLKGPVLQAVHYLATGEPFCEDEQCRLHNAHRHGGVLAAQLSEPEFCETHTERYG